MMLYQLKINDNSFIIGGATIIKVYAKSAGSKVVQKFGDVSRDYIIQDLPDQGGLAYIVTQGDTAHLGIGSLGIVGEFNLLNPRQISFLNNLDDKSKQEIIALIREVLQVE